MYCKNCGNEISNTATFCDGCGERIVGNAQKKKEQEERFANEQASDTNKPIRSGGDNKEGYRLFADRLVIAKKGKLETIQMSDIASAKLSFGSVTIVKKDQKIISLMSLKKEEIADWINDINRYTQGEGNFVPMSQATAMEAVKSFNKKAIIVVVAIVAVVLFFIFSGGTSSKVSDEDYYSAAKTVVSQNLRAPTTAKYYNWKILAQDDYGRTIVFCNVDSQNGFGGYGQLSCYVLITSYNTDDDTFTYNTDVIMEEGNLDFLADTYVERLKGNVNWNQPLD